MKTFLITITILGAIIYGMLEINEYYDDRGACSWGLLDGGYYLHKERLDNVTKALIKEIIERDKYARQKLMQQQGLGKDEIAKKIKALEPQYNIEREKMVKYCYLDFEKEPYFQKKSMGIKPSTYCEVGNGNNSGNDWLFPYISFDLKYTFDKESLEFFNEVQYLTKLMRPSRGVKEKVNTWYPYIFYGIKFENGFEPCKTKYYGGETTGWLQKYDKAIHTYNKTEQIIAY